MEAGGSSGKAKSEINVTPLIDIVLVLLIVFIVLIPGLTKALPVAVPQILKTGAPAPDPRNPQLVILVDANGSLSLQSDRIELSRLRRDAITLRVAARTYSHRAEGQRTFHPPASGRRTARRVAGRQKIHRKTGRTIFTGEILVGAACHCRGFHRATEPAGV